jgi:hypothetical protein
MSSYNALFGLGSHSVDSSLEGWWRLQETTGTSATDSSGKGRTITIDGMGSNPVTASGPTGWLGSAFVLDGSNDKMDLSTEITLNSPYTMGAWYREDASHTSIAAIFASKTNAQPLFAVNWNSNNLVGFRVNQASSAPDLDRNLGFSESTWTMLGVRYQSSTNDLAYFHNTTKTSVSFSRTTPAFTLGSFGYRGQSDSLRAKGRMAGMFAFSRYLSDAEYSEVYNGPEPLNTVDPTLIFGVSTWTGTVGTWDSQSNGTITYAWQLRRASDNGVEQSGTGASPGGSNPAAGSYYLWVRASNDGGFDSAEDSVSDVEVLSGGDDKEGSGTITAIGNVTGSGSTTRSGSGSFGAVGNLVGSGQKVSSASGTITAIGILEGTGLAPAVGEKTGFGSITAIGTLTATGQSVRSGSGSFAAIGILEGTGEAPVVGGASGSGSVTAIGSLTGQATTVRSGSGSFGAVGHLSGMGRMVAAASGQISAIGNIVGVGSNQQGSMILQYYYYLGS